MNGLAKQPNIWKIPSADLSLEKDEVHVWLVNFAEENAADFSKILSEDERARANRFRFEKDRNNFIIGRGTLRKILGEYLQTNPQQIRFEYGQFGKPFLSSNLKFNLSHSENLALFAFSFDCEVGIDIEHRKADFIEEGTISICLTPKETEHFHSLAPNKQDLYFFDCWTSKEAYLKANGCGLSLSPNEFEIFNLNQTQFSFQKLPAIDGFSTALAVEGANPQIKFWQAN
jgi:4'-phosphopantetheinyl transferase